MNYEGMLVNRGQRQIIAEKVASTVRILELLGLQYRVGPPERNKDKGNASPRVIVVATKQGKELRIYNGKGGNTWAHFAGGKPVKGVKSIEDLYMRLTRPI